MLIDSPRPYQPVDRAPRTWFLQRPTMRGTPVRIRLNSTVLRARNPGNSVEVTYLHAGQCVLACWGVMIPHLCPELPPAQAAALHSEVKVPLVYVSILL